MKAKIIMEIKFSKSGLMRYISHLDLLRYFRRAASRAGIVLEHTCGFNPHPKISIEKALRLGLEADDLVCQFGLKEEIAPCDFLGLLSGQMPQGIKIGEARLIKKN